MRIVLLTTARSYRAEAFLAAAQNLNVEVVQGIDMDARLAGLWEVPLALDFQDTPGAVAAIVRYARQHPVAAVLGVDDSATILAAEASAALGLPHNATEAAVAARDKH